MLIFDLRNAVEFSHIPLSTAVCNRCSKWHGSNKNSFPKASWKFVYTPRIG